MHVSCPDVGQVSNTCSLSMMLPSRSICVHVISHFLNHLSEVGICI